MSKRNASTSSIGEATKTLILDTAESLIGERGPGALSIRAIADAAGVNLSAVNYYFISKEKLIEKVFERRVIPLNEKRLALLAAAEALAGINAIPSLDAILEAFVAPTLELAATAAGNARSMVALMFVSQTFLASGEDVFLDRYYEPLRSRFIVALMKAAPALSMQEVIWRYNFLVGAMVYAMGASARIRMPPMGFRSTLSETNDDLQQSIRQFVVYAAAGFSAPSARQEDEASTIKAHHELRCDAESMQA